MGIGTVCDAQVLMIIKTKIKKRLQVVAVLTTGRYVKSINANKPNSSIECLYKQLFGVRENVIINYIAHDKGLKFPTFYPHISFIIHFVYNQKIHRL